MTQGWEAEVLNCPDIVDNDDDYYYCYYDIGDNYYYYCNYDIGVMMVMMIIMILDMVITICIITIMMFYLYVNRSKVAK